MARLRYASGSLRMPLLCLPLCVCPLLLQQWALLRIHSLLRTHWGQSHMHICLQAAHLVLCLHLFLPHCSGVHLRLLLPLVQGSDMQGHPPRQLSRVKLSPGMPLCACVCPQSSTCQQMQRGLCLSIYLFCLHHLFPSDKCFFRKTCLAICLFFLYQLFQDLFICLSVNF